MPLVMICGYPASGKTTLAIKLAAFLQDHLKGHQVQIVNDEYLKIPSNDYFSEASEEKKVRAALLAASERFVKKDTVVIVDSLNYIKGFRYQLYCQARAASTPHLLIHCQAREDTCRAWNAQRPAGGRSPYPADQLEDLILRFEEPNNQTKWDSPLFTILAEDTSDAQLEDVFLNSILPKITSEPIRPPSMATSSFGSLSSSTASSSSAAAQSDLSVLTEETQSIIDAVLKHQQDQLPLVKFVSTTKILALPRPVSNATLSRVRRQFLHMNRLHPISDREKIRNLFIDYLSSNMYL